MNLEYSISYLCLLCLNAFNGSFEEFKQQTVEHTVFKLVDGYNQIINFYHFKMIDLGGYELYFCVFSSTDESLTRLSFTSWPQFTQNHKGHRQANLALMSTHD